ncbi:MAG: hypothetical protein AAF519_19570 [Bacteroidota bacterium]
MRVAIICHGSVSAGLGHLFRSRTFANYSRGQTTTRIFAIIERGLENIFYTQKDITQFHYHQKSLFSNVSSFKPDIIVFDMLEIEEPLFYKLDGISALKVSISPIFNMMEHVEMRFLRSKYFEPIENVETFGGLKYAIVNEYCKKVPLSTFKRNLAQDYLPIAVSMGGSDAPNKTLKVVEKLTQFPHELMIWVVLGEGYSHSYTKLVQAGKSGHQHEIILAKASKSTWDIMSNTALTILAGGLTSVESVIAGIPSINIFEKPEHMKLMAQELNDHGVALNNHLFSDESLEELLERLHHFYFNRSELLKIRQKLQGTIDQKGAERVFKAVKRRFYF